MPSKHQYMDMSVEERKNLGGTSAKPLGTQSLLGYVPLGGRDRGFSDILVSLSFLQPR